jgi:uncharacterized coiled-coil protein SlyX
VSAEYPQDIATATKSYKEWLTYRRMTSQPKSWNKYSHLRFHPSAPQDFEPEAITKLMEEINRNWDLDIETKDETINSLRDQLADKVVEAVKSQKKLSTLDKELREYNNTSIELLLAEKSQREAIDEIEKAEKELKELKEQSQRRNWPQNLSIYDQAWWVTLTLRLLR